MKDPNERRKYRSRDGRYMPKKESNGLFKASLYVAGAAGAGIAAYSAFHKSGGGRKLAQTLDVQGRAFARSIQKTESERDLRKGRFSEENSKKLKENYQKEREKILDKRKRNKFDREFEVEKDLRRMFDYVGRDKNKANSGLADDIDDTIRMKRLEKQVKEDGSLELRNQFNKIKSEINKMDIGRLRKADDAEMGRILSKAGISDDVINEFNKKRISMGTNNLILHDKEASDAYKKAKEKIQKTFVDNMVSGNKKDYKSSQKIRGKSKATVDDVLNIYKENKIKINEETVRNLEDAKKLNESFGSLVYDSNLYLNKKGKTPKLEDFHVFKEVARKNTEFWSRSIPGGIFHLRNYLSIKEAEETVSIRTLKRGSVQSSINPYINKKSTEQLDSHLIYMKGKVYDIFSDSNLHSTEPLEALNKKRDVFLTSSRYGSLPRMYRAMAGTLNGEDNRNLFMRFADFGRQDTDSIYGRAKSSVLKFNDDNWGRTKGLRIIDEGIRDYDDFLFMSNLTKGSSYGGLDHRTLTLLNPHLSDTVKGIMKDEDFSFSNPISIEHLFREIGEREAVMGNLTTSKSFMEAYSKYLRSPDDFMAQKRRVGEVDPLFKSPVDYITGEDIIRQEVSSYLMQSSINSYLVNNKKGFSVESYADAFDFFRGEMKDNLVIGKVTKDEYKNAMNLINYSQVSMVRNGGVARRRDFSNEILDEMLSYSSQFRESLEKTVKTRHPLRESYNMNPFDNLVNDDYILMGKANLGDNFRSIFGLTSDMEQRGSAVKDIYQQLSASRNRMDDTTLLTMGPFYSGYRLQEMISHIGLGLSDSSMRSTLHVYGNLFAKRVFPSYAGYEGFKYIDYELDVLTGRGITERYEDAKAEHRLERAHEMSNQDRYDILKAQQLRPGFEHFEATPSIYLPGLGEVAPLGQAVSSVVSLASGQDFLTGIDTKESYTVSETYDDLFYGTEEVRKSKWWLAGSKSAYRGDRIIEFAPNSWRLAHSDWEYSGVGLTGEEYWSHSMFPTLQNPLGGLSYVFGLRDPYYFEKKHYEDRPYMLTGELFNSNTPLLGDVGNATIGRLIKPTHQMHKEYWNGKAEPYEVNGLQQQMEQAEILSSVSSKGAISFFQDLQPYGFEPLTEESSIERLSYLMQESELDQNPKQTTSLNIRRDGVSTMGDGAFNPDLNVSIENRARDAAITHNENNDFIFKYSLSEDLYGNSESPFLFDPNSLAFNESLYGSNQSIQREYKFREEYDYNDYYQEMLEENVHDPRSFSWKNQELKENWSEPLGVYKWLYQDEFLGNDNYVNKMVIQRADTAYDASGEFWESNLGSLGGGYSEMARRFVRKDSGMLEHYNPIRNTIPEWLPGEDYFINFLEGDPYTKVQHGERRLPGAGYESLNELHPDEFGEYGAFDRFKILADVAPYSKEYDFWSQYVLENELDSELRSQAHVIRKQASKVKQKFEFTDYRFKNNEVTSKRVTVDRILDDFTFTTKEFGSGSPIRLAGIEYKNSHTGMLSEFISEGQSIQIEIDADETQRKNNDTYGTMKAVLRDRKTNINQMIIESGRAVEDMTDFSAPGVHARFTEEEIETGKRWEGIAHAPTMLNTKFLPIRTAVEEYERDQVYGRDWATWDNLLTRDYLMPAVEGLGRHDNPLWSIGAGMTTGYVTSIFTLPKGGARKIAAGVGAVLGAGMFIVDKQSQFLIGKKDVPNRRVQEAMINEYYDFLEYLKYKSLFEKSKKEYEKKHKVDLDEYFDEIENKKEELGNILKKAEDKKKYAYTDPWEMTRVQNDDGTYRYESERKNESKVYNQIIEMTKEELSDLDIIDNEELAQVIHYKTRMERTMYGLDMETATVEDIMAALPHKDRYFFNEFKDATEEEREELRKLLPSNILAIYEAYWSNSRIKRPSLKRMFDKFKVPDAQWDGWKPEYNLDDIKMKTVAEKEELDLTDFGFWETDLYRGDYVPELNSKGGNHLSKGGNMRRGDVERILRGQGLKNVEVLIDSSRHSSGSVLVDFELDRSKEIEESIKRDISKYM